MPGTPVQTETAAPKKALSHEAEIHERVRAEREERVSKPPVAAGSIVLVDVPASRETGGVEMTVPAIVLAQDEQMNLRLSCFHLGGLFQMTAHPGAVQVVLEAKKPK